VRPSARPSAQAPPSLAGRPAAPSSWGRGADRRRGVQPAGRGHQQRHPAGGGVPTAGGACNLLVAVTSSAIQLGAGWRPPAGRATCWSRSPAAPSSWRRGADHRRGVPLPASCRPSIAANNPSGRCCALPERCHARQRQHRQSAAPMSDSVPSCRQAIATGCLRSAAPMRRCRIVPGQPLPARRERAPDRDPPAGSGADAGQLAGYRWRDGPPTASSLRPHASGPCDG
jgi:hypothetical protein